MFEEQEVKIRVKELNQLDNIIMALRQMGIDFKEAGDNHYYEITANHEELFAKLRLYKKEEDAITE